VRLVRHTLYSLTLIAGVIALMFGVRATPFNSLMTDDHDDNRRVERSSSERGDRRRNPRNQDFDPAGIVAAAGTLVPQAAIVAGVAVLEGKRRRKKTEAIRQATNGDPQ
jgi:hypothetical protein